MSIHCLREISLEAIASVHPSSLLRPFVQLRCSDDVSEVVVDGKSFSLNDSRGCHVVGFGKAVLGMAAELNRL